jgi:type II secretory pathway component PulF
VRDDHQLALFHRTLAELCRSEVPLGRAFALLDADLAEGPLKEAVRGLAADVEAGTPLAEAYKKRAAALPPLYGALVEAGVASGDLPGTLAEIARHAALRAEVATRLRRALAQPTLSAAFIALVGAVLLVFVAPRFAEILAGFDAMYEGMALAVPWYGRPGPFLAAAVAVLAASAVATAAFAFLRNPIDGSSGPLGLGFRWPAIGPIRLYAALAQNAATIALLLRRGLPLGRALDLTAAATDDPALRGRVEAMAKASRDGAGLADAIRGSGIYPPSLVWLVSAAEARGAAADVVDDIAAIYRDRLARAVDRMSVVVVPAAQVVLGVVVFAFVYGTMSPIFVVARLVTAVGP